MFFMHKSMFSKEDCATQVFKSLASPKPQVLFSLDIFFTHVMSEGDFKRISINVSQSLH